MLCRRNRFDLKVPLGPYRLVNKRFADISGPKSQKRVKGEKEKKNFMAPFYAWGSTAPSLEPLQGGSLLFATKFSEIPGTHFIDLARIKR